MLLPCPARPSASATDRAASALFLTAALALLLSARADAQVTSVRSLDSLNTRSPIVAAERRDSVMRLADSKRTQALFEAYHRQNLPERKGLLGGSNGKCDERVGRFCYWYDPDEPPPPPELERVTLKRNELIATLDSAALASPGDDWVAGQRVRYLAEAGRTADAVTAALACAGTNWWCAALRGFAAHEDGRYVMAEAAYDSALALMPPRQACDWRDISLLLDDRLLARYRASKCGDAEREEFERKIWWLARPLMSSPANDARTEHFARVTMAKMVEGGPSTHAGGFDEDERELTLRYSWPREWSRTTGGITGHEPTPAYPYLPNSSIFDNPLASDSAKWTTEPGIVRARYAPRYAVPMRKLEHQAAMFRRGDSALVAFAYTVEADPVMAPADKEVALVLTHGEPADATIVRVTPPANRAVVTAFTEWKPVLMSAEVVSYKARKTARARYALRPPYGTGARVTISDILLFAPYGTLPTSAEEALPHMLPSLRVKAGGKLGFFWEAYGTAPQGEVMGITLVVVKEEDDPSFWQRRLQALRLWKDAAPVSISVSDVSARGLTTSPRAVEVDISTLAPGAYVVQLEIEVENQYRVRAERRIEVLE